jgi:hypothetical protein
LWEWLASLTIKRRFSVVNIVDIYDDARWHVRWFFEWEWEYGMDRMADCMVGVGLVRCFGWAGAMDRG